MKPNNDVREACFEIFSAGGSVRDALKTIDAPQSTIYKYHRDWRKTKPEPAPVTLEIIDGGGGLDAEIRFIKRRLQAIANGSFDDPRGAAVAVSACNAYLKALQLESTITNDEDDDEPLDVEDRAKRVGELLALAKSRRDAHNASLT
jgi:hypothetical protein